MITLQFGQCGNQLGDALFSKISSDLECTNIGVPFNVNYQYSEATFNKWFTNISRDGKRLARTILVDSEEKVISQICKKEAPTWSYCTKNIICQAGGGCGNNWAYGYNVKGNELCNAILNATRKEVERLDRLEAFLLLSSSAGGTGSGIGCKITDVLRTEYKTKLLVNAVILPFPFGEVCTQHYNSLFTFAKLYDSSDIVLLFENQQIYRIHASLLKTSFINFKHMNEIITEKLLSILQPVTDPNYNMNFVISQIVSHPLYKLATIKSAPHVSPMSLEYEPVQSWQSYIQHMKQTLRISNSNSESLSTEHKHLSKPLKYTSHHKYAPSVSNVMVTRGSIGKTDSIDTHIFHDRSIYAKWNRFNQFSHFHERRKFLNKDKALALITNNGEVSHILDAFINKSWNAYVHSAYVHHYEKFGLEKDDFLRAFGIMENIRKEYQSLMSDV